MHNQGDIVLVNTPYLYIVFGILFIIVIVIAFLFLNPKIRYGKLQHNKNKKSDCIIILGYPANINGTPSPILSERIKQGIELYKNGVAEKIICSGGATKNEHIEADVMANELIKHDIPESNIIPEKDSRSTWENLKFSKKIMQDNSFKTAVIVSQTGHIRRSSIYATEMGIKHTVKKANMPGILILLAPLIYTHIYYRINRDIFKYLSNKHK